MTTTSEDQKLALRLGHEFSDPALLAQALTHRSSAGDNNERLEFLGDSLVNFIIAEALYRKFPEAEEGQLSRLRAHLVRGATLAEIAAEFRLGNHLRLGSGELKSGGWRRESILADALEAVIGAIFLDAGVQACRCCVLTWYTSRLDELTLRRTVKDAKTRLQEHLQARQRSLPVYETVSVEGQAHAQRFTVSCTVETLAAPTFGEGGSRRQAEQCAAAKALELLGEPA